MGIVLLALGSVIKNGYRLHDAVTGAMILEETLERARYNRDETQTAESFARAGTETGTPRLWLGTYRIELLENGTHYQGRATAGDWQQEMEISAFSPGEKLRKYQAVYKLARKWDEKK